MMFRYIDMPKLVAYYLREFSYRRDGTTSTLYQFVFSLCLPFVSKQFRSARLAALAIAECTNSATQIKRLFNKLMDGDTTLTILSHNSDFLLSWDGTGAEPLFPFDGSAATNDPQVLYSPSPNLVDLTVAIPSVYDDAKFESVKQTAAAYLQLLIPFYIQTNINYKKAWQNSLHSTRRTPR